MRTGGLEDLVTVEFFGIPRCRAGRDSISVRARTVGELLEAVQVSCPGLSDLRGPGGGLARHYLLSLDGRQFVDNPGQSLRPGVPVLLLSADAGG